jgi:hypothetical protein
MLLMCFVGLQAVLGLLFFSPSAAALCRGTPDPTLGFPGRPAGRPGTQPGPDLGPVPRGDVPGFLRSMFAWTGRAGTRPGAGPRARAPGRAGPGAGSHDGGFDDMPGWRLRGFPSSGCRAPPALCSPAWVILLLRLPCLVCLLLFLRGPSEPTGGGRAASTPSRGSLGALWRHAAAAASGFGPPFFAPSSALARAGPGPSASSPAGAAGRD